jgi:long-chain acyl-CoA synthetase
LNLNLWLLHLAHLFAWVHVDGREHLNGLKGPVLFASNHQSFFDTPAIFIAMPWKWRHRLAPTMRKEFFEAHFHPREHGWFQWFTNSLNYWLSLLMFNAVPIPQDEAGTRQALRALGELVEAGDCPLIFPEGRHSQDENLYPFQAGVAMIASRLHIPVVPIRLRGSNRVLPQGARMARPGRVTVTIGEPLRLEGEDYAALTRLLEERIRAL